jgi:hypothetical protein
VRHYGVTLLLTLATSLSAYAQGIDTTKVVAEAQVSARAWLVLVDQTSYGVSWDSAAAVFRSAIARPDWEQAVLQARAPFEPFGARKLLRSTFATSLPGAPQGEYVVLQYETRVSKDRIVVETVTPKKEPDGRWRVSGYFVRPR